MAFIGPDRVILFAFWQRKHGVVIADLVEFPSGEVVAKLKIPPRPTFPAADPAFVIVRDPEVVVVWPGGRSHQDAAAAVHLTTGQVIPSVYPALDVFGQYYVAESNLGEVGLYEIGKGLQAKIKLTYDPALLRR